MTEIEKLDTTAKQIGDEIIDISTSLDKNMEKWSGVTARSDNPDAPERAGFITKETATTGINLVVDVQVPADEDQGVLRLWAIDSNTGDDSIERFNNVQLDFAADYEQAHALAKKGGEVTRDDIRAMLHDQATRLSRVIVGNQSGVDNASGQSVGERYDLTVSDLDGHEAAIGKANAALQTVVSTLKASAAK